MFAWFRFLCVYPGLESVENVDMWACVNYCGLLTNIISLQEPWPIIGETSEYIEADRIIFVAEYSIDNYYYCSSHL